MKLHEAIEDEVGYQDFLASVREECSDFLAVADAHFPLFRGIEEAPLFGEKAIRTNREPSDTNEISNRIYNYFAEKDTGVANLREKVAFCSGKKRIAAQFGYLNFVLPVNGTRYFYSEGVADSLSLMRTIEVRLDKVPPTTPIEKLIKLYDAQKLTFPTIREEDVKHLIPIISAGYEIMLYGAPKYYFQKELSMNDYIHNSHYGRLLSQLRNGK